MNAIVSPYTNTSNPQTIYVNVTNTITGCDIATMSFNIEVQEGALANSDGDPILYELCDDNMETDGDTTNDTVQFDLSTQDAAVLDGQDPANYTVSYYATAADAEAGTNPLPTLYENVVNPQVIYVRVDNDTTPDSVCYATAELTLQVNPLPMFDLEDEYLLCIDTNGTEVVSPPILETNLSDVDYTFEWYLESVLVGTGSSYVPLQGGNYSVTVTDNLTGCQNTDTTIVYDSQPPQLIAEVTTLAFASNHAILATATGGGIGEYEFSLDNGPWEMGTETGGVWTYTFEGVNPGTHVVTARDINGCGETSVEVIVMDYPRFFTPNGDGYHDTWNIYGISNQPNAKIYIFDRYGKLIKQLSPTGAGWNGTYNGNPLPSSDYWFTVEYQEPNASDGSIVTKEFKPILP